MSWFGWGKKKKGEGEEDEKDEHADEKKDPQQGDDGQEGEEDDEEPLPQCEALGEADPRKLDYKSEEKVLARTEALRELIAEHYAAQVKAGEMESADVPTPGDAELRRFLRARKYKPPKSLQLFIQERAWRRENHIDQITAAVDAGEMAYQYIAPHRHHNFDRLGRPVYIEKTGLVRMQNLLKHRSANDCVWRHVRSVEQILHRMRESTAADLGGHGHAVEQQVVIMDLKGLSFKIDFTALGVFKRTIDIDQKYYPERLGKLFMINAPWIFKSYWAVIKHFVDARTKAKFSILGSDYSKELLEIIDAKYLPKEWGGECECGETSWGGSCLPPVRAFPPTEEEEEKKKKKKNKEEEEEETVYDVPTVAPSDETNQRTDGNNELYWYEKLLGLKKNESQSPTTTTTAESCE